MRMPRDLKPNFEPNHRFPDTLSKVLASANIVAGVDPESSLALLVPSPLLEVQAKEVRARG